MLKRSKFPEIHFRCSRIHFSLFLSSQHPSSHTTCATRVTHVRKYYPLYSVRTHCYKEISDTAAPHLASPFYLPTEPVLLKSQPLISPKIPPMSTPPLTIRSDTLSAPLLSSGDATANQVSPGVQLQGHLPAEASLMRIPTRSDIATWHTI